MSVDDELKALLTSAQAMERRTSEATERGWARIDERLRAGLGPSVPVDVRGVPGFSNASVPWLAKVGLLVAAVAVVAAVSVAGTTRGPARTLRAGALGEFAPLAQPVPTKIVDIPAQPTPSPLPAAPSEARTDGVSGTAAPAVIPPTERPSKAKKIRPEKPAASRLSEETALLRKAWAALDTGRGVQAATMIATHEREFPKGSLVEEREAVRAVLGCKRDADQAERLAAAFATRYPKSVHRTRVRRACDKE